MANFPNMSRQPFPRKNTMQGGNTSVPPANPQARGIGNFQPSAGDKSFGDGAFKMPGAANPMGGAGNMRRAGRPFPGGGGGRGGGVGQNFPAMPNFPRRPQPRPIGPGFPGGGPIFPGGDRGNPLPGPFPTPSPAPSPGPLPGSPGPGPIGGQDNDPWAFGDDTGYEADSLKDLIAQHFSRFTNPDREGDPLDADRFGEHERFFGNRGYSLGDDDQVSFDPGAIDFEALFSRLGRGELADRSGFEMPDDNGGGPLDDVGRDFRQDGRGMGGRGGLPTRGGLNDRRQGGGGGRGFGGPLDGRSAGGGRDRGGLGGGPGETMGPRGNDLPPDPNTDEEFGDVDPGDISSELLGKARMPLDAQFRRQQGSLSDALTAAMARLEAQRSGLIGFDELGQARMATQQDEGLSDLQNAMAARGIFGSGIQNRDTRMMNADFDRARQDNAFDFTNNLGELDAARSGSILDFRMGLQDALTQLAQRMSQDRRAALPKGGRGGRG